MGQSTIEYLLALTAILLALLYGVQANGPVQRGLQSIMSGTESAMKKDVDAAKQRFYK
jgi:hypothetical protein